MNSKLLSIIALFAMLCLSMTARAEKKLQRIDVSTVKEFIDALKVEYTDDKHGRARGADIHLLNDIDFSTAQSDGNNIIFDGEFVLEGNWFGKISGAGVDKDGEETVYALKNIHYTLFGKLIDAEISDLIIASGSFNGRDTSSGMIADECENTTIKGVMFLNITATGNSDGIDCDNMGTAVGYAKNSTFAGLLFSSCKLVTDGQDLGHVAGYAENCKIFGCITDAQSSLWGDGNSVLGFDGNAYVGGICGEAVKCEIERCVNMSTVSSDDDRIGGIVGYASDGTTLTDCRNGGVVKHCTMDDMGHLKRKSVERGLLYTSIATTFSSFVMYGFSAWQQKVGDVEDTVWKQVKANWHKTYSTYKTTQTDIDAETLVFTHQDIVKNTYSMKDVCKTAAQFRSQYAAAHGIFFGAIGNTIMYVLSFAPEALPVVAAVAITSYLTMALYNSLTSDPDEMGGIVGTMTGGGSILRCVNEGPVVCLDDDCGGIVGQLDGSTVESCYNRTFVRGKTDVGGIVGYALNGSTVKNCLNLGAVTSSGADGYYGVIGELGSGCSVSDNYYLYDENKDHTICQSVTQDKLASGWVACQLNKALTGAGKEALWRQKVGGENADFAPSIDAKEKPLVTEVAKEGSYSIVQNITNGGDFALACANPLAQISLKASIDLSGVSVLMSTYQHPFRGHINGNGFTISNFNYQSSEEDYRATEDAEAARPHDIALFPYATGATFENFIIDGFNINQKDETLIYAYREGLLVGTADHCLFKNITVRNSRILYNNDDPKWLVGGLVGLAKNTSSSADDISYFENVTVEMGCSFSAFIGNREGSAYLGGVAGQASKTVFDHCQYSGTLWADDDYVGGICGYAAGCGFFGCLNTGTIVGQACVGGIVGRALSCEIKESVNTGTLYGDNGDGDNNYIGGIVGNIDGSSSVKYCLGFGAVMRGKKYCGGIEGKGYGVEGVDCANNHWHYSLNGALQSDFVGAESFPYTEKELLSGLFAFFATNGDNERYLYQYIDGNPFCTNLPVPIAKAGTVYYNFGCRSNLGEERHLSNIYDNNTYGKHNYVGGVCSRCGHISEEIPEEIHLSSAEDLKAISYGVSKGVDYKKSYIILDADIDLKDVTYYLPIGCTPEAPFRGHFDGNNHRIKNLKVSNMNGMAATGLFGYVGGNTFISNLVIDSSCSISSNTEWGVSALVGCFASTSGGTETETLYIESCGNEANVTGVKGVGGLVGNVLFEGNSAVHIFDSYNSGNIVGASQTAAITGNAGINPLVAGCWNMGYVAGATDKYGMVGYNYASSSSPSIYYNYQLNSNTSEQSAQAVSLTDAYMGCIAFHLNAIKGKTIWGQNIGTDSHPVFSDKDVRHERNMSGQWDTAILPFYATSDDNVQLYILESSDVTSADASVTMKPVDMVDAHTPFIFRKKNDAAASVCINMTSDVICRGMGSSAPSDNNAKHTVSTDAEGWSLTGTYTDLTDLKDVYSVAQDRLLYADDNIELPAFRAYLSHENIIGSTQSLRILVSGEGTTTQIGEIRDGKMNFFDQPVYNLAGQRVTRDYKGIAVTKGKKIIIK